MTLSIDEKKAIIKYRIQKAWNSIQEADDNARLGYWTLAASRLYYAAYYMASALLVDKGFIARSHSGVIHIIGSEFVKKDFLSKEDGRLFHDCLTCVNQAITMIFLIGQKKRYNLSLIRQKIF